MTGKDIQAYLKNKKQDWDEGIRMIRTLPVPLNIVHRLGLVRSPSLIHRNQLKRALNAVLALPKYQVDIMVVKELTEEDIKEVSTDKRAPIPNISIKEIPKNKAEGEEIEILERENVSLDTSKSMISNKLRDPQGNEIIRLDNCKYLDQIKSLRARINKNRQRIFLLKKGSVKADTISDLDASNAVVVYLPKGDSYTISELKEILSSSPPKFSKIKKTITDAISNRKRLAKNAKKPITRQKSEMDLIKLEKEREIMDQIHKGLI